MIHFVLALASLIAAVEPALAHAPIEGIGVFYNGMLHLLFVPSQLLAVTALGLLLGQHAPQHSRCGWFAFVAAFWFGLAAGYWVGQGVPQAIFLVLALIAGLMVAFEWAFGLVFIVALATVVGVGIGLDSTPDGAPHREMSLALAGTAVGGVLLLSCVGGLASCFTRPWQRIGIRAAGSWTAATAGIVLMLVWVGPKVAG